MVNEYAALINRLNREKAAAEAKQAAKDAKERQKNGRELAKLTQEILDGDWSEERGYSDGQAWAKKAQYEKLTEVVHRFTHPGMFVRMALDPMIPAKCSKDFGFDTTRREAGRVYRSGFQSGVLYVWDQVRDQVGARRLPWAIHRLK